jgi:hypothetical protein
MARVPAVLGAVWTAMRRDSRSLASFTGNNFFFVSLLLLFFSDPGGFTTLNIILAVVLFFPLSADPLRKVPRARLAIWPIATGEYRLLRVLSVWLNPLTWLLAALAIWRSVSIGLWTLVAVLFAIGFLAPSVRLRGGMSPWRWLPPMPGPLNQLVRKNLREMLSTLDFYCAVMLTGGAFVLRLKGLIPAAAALPMTLLVMLALSTYAQALFGLDGDGGMARYRLLPLAGWQILAAKDAAYIAIAVLLTLPWSPLAGFAAAVTALALGHYTSVNRRRAQTRWRFTTGASFGGAIVQVLLMDLAAAAVFYYGPLVAAIPAAAYACSTWWFGRVWQRGA